MPKGKRKAGGPIMLDIKLRFLSKSGPPTDAQVVQALEHMLATGGEVPAGWQFAAIDWSRPAGGSQGFSSGSVANFAQFAPLIRSQLHRLKVRSHREPPKGG